MVSLWFVTPAWGRPKVTKLALAQRALLVKELSAWDIEANCVVVANDENLEIAKEFGFEAIEMDNTSIGRKVNAGIAHACLEGNADFIAPIGSDNWVHRDFFVSLDPYTIRTGRQLAVVDLSRGKMRSYRCHHSHGIIPWLIPRSFLGRSGFAPMDHDARPGNLDGNMAEKLGHARRVFHDPHNDLTRVDFKTAANLSSYEHLAAQPGAGREIDAWPVLSEHYPAELIALAKVTSRLI